MATITKPSAVASKPSAVKPSAAPVASKAPPAKPAAAAPTTPAKPTRPGGPPAPAAASKAPPAAPPAAPQAPGVGAEILKQIAALSALVTALQKDVAALQKRASNAPATAEPLTEEELLQRAEKAKGLVPAEDPRHAYHGANLTLKLMSIAPNGAISAREEGGTFQAFLLIPSDADGELDAKGKSVCSGASARAAGKLACYYAPSEDGKHSPQGMIHLTLAELAALWAED